MFEIDRDTGVLSVVKPLDFEKTKMYRFQVRAFNNYDGELRPLYIFYFKVIICQIIVIIIIKSKYI